MSSSTAARPRAMSYDRSRAICSRGSRDSLTNARCACSSQRQRSWAIQQARRRGAAVQTRSGAPSLTSLPAPSTSAKCARRAPRAAGRGVCRSAAGPPSARLPRRRRPSWWRRPQPRCTPTRLTPARALTLAPTLTLITLITLITLMTLMTLITLTLPLTLTLIYTPTYTGAHPVGRRGRRRRGGPMGVGGGLRQEEQH